jgi:imidazolonepropionase-like amidohydrolase
MTTPTPTPTVTERGRLTALRAAWLFDGTGSALIPDPLVVIDGGTIVAVGSGAPAPDGADVVDLDGATLLPGLVDTHVHLAFDASADPVGALAARSDEETTEAMIRAGQAALAGGVTTVRDLGDRDYLSLGLRGQPGLPTILAAGPPVTTAPAGHCHYLGGCAEPTEAGVRAAVWEHVERGVDVIKIMASGGTLTPGTYQHLCQFTPEVLRAAVDEAHRHGLPVTAHAHAVQAIADGVSAGADGLEHVSFWTETSVDAPAELIQLIADRRTVVGLTVGMVPIPGLEPPPVVMARLPLIVANMRRMHEAGAVMVAGSDAGIGPVKPHGVVRHAPDQLREAGIGQAEALRMITSGAAEVIGLGHRKGRVAPGFDADILAVDGDPLADPAALHRIRAVWARGAAVPGAGTAQPAA